MKARRWRMVEIKMFVSFRKMERRRERNAMAYKKEKKNKKKERKEREEGTLRNAREKIWR